MKITKAIMDFEKVTKSIQERDGCSRCTAMEKAAREFPDALEAYRQQGREITEKAAKRPEQPFAVRKFNEIADDIARRDKCPKHVALEKARKEHREAFELYRSA